MAQLDSGVKKILIGGNVPPRSPSYQPHFISEVEAEESLGKERYFRWLSRLVMLCAFVSLSFFLSSTLVIFRLAPEIIVEPLLLVSNQTDSKNLVRYEPIAENMPSLKQMTEMFIKQYVIMRNTVVIDEREMTTRWGIGGIVQYLSSEDVYADFVGPFASDVGRLYNRDYSSEVYIDRIGKEGENSPSWTVDFTVHHLSQSRNNTGTMTLKTERFRASVTPRYYPGRKLVTRRLVNPLGFMVEKYNQSEIRE